ncbi:non-ribosomal peptide synthetase [Paenibacillus faecalis]|uniref:non-ribosomal peptide synthetase n=1 Tax=Paenibacillus faecalis TaxID=2079532 RepID=UPI000D0E7A12|nr:non-ribosomal peptide synthetase [Paenibacillus faecalis]
MSKKYRMSSAQKRMFVISEMNKDSIIYNVPMLWRIKGALDVDRLQYSFRELCARHELLRTRFVHNKDKFLQVVEDEVEFNLECVDGAEEEISGMFRDFVKPFELSQAPLMRAKAVRITADEIILMLDIHHIIFDDGSKSVLLGDLSQLYNGEKLPPLRIQYKDYSSWQNARDMQDQESYWLGQFAEEVPVLDLKTDYPRPQQQSYKGCSVPAFLNLEIKAMVKQWSQSSGATEYMILLSCFMYLLSRYSQQESIVVGSPIAGRVHPDTEQMLGMFVNTLAIRGDIRDGMTFRTLLNQIQDTCFMAYENQEYPFEFLVEKSGVERDPSRNPIFDVMFVLQNSEEGTLAFGEAKLSPMDIDFTVAKFDLTVSVEETKDGYTLNWEYCKELFLQETIEHMAQHFNQLIFEALSHPDRPLAELQMITTLEREAILNKFNATDMEYPSDKSVIRLFEEQAARVPDHIAVEYEGQTITYRELNARANAVGARLRAKEVGPDRIVGLIAERSIEMMIGIYGILKAGGAYLPIDPEQPLERIRFILEDSGASHVVFTQGTDKVTTMINGMNGLHMIDLMEVTESMDENLPSAAGPEHLAYVIYTSGTTGQPKGVLIENKSLVNLAAWQRAQGDMDENSVMLQKSTYIFDASVWEIFSVGLAGGRLIMASEWQNKDPRELLQLIAARQVSHALIVPSSFRALLEYAETHHKQDQFMSLQKIYLGAEALTPELLAKYTRLTGNGAERLINLYGPTEATVCATSLQLSDHYTVTIPIGKPLWNTQIYILQGDWLCGYGVPGELCIGGAGVSRGYLNRPDLTSDQFISDPYRQDGRIYRTGDLARWRPDGTIEYLGRTGDQVKIRGFRVELGEIESRLRELDSIQDTSVIVRADATGHDYLCAYVVGSVELNTEEIRENLRQSLPAYMVPSYVVQLESLPLTRSGKLDKKALPEPDRTSSQAYTAPRDNLEEALVDAFSDVLGMDRVGIDDDFYALGGDSIKAIRILSKLRERGYDIGVRTIMQGRTIRSMREDVKASNGVQAEQGEITGIVKLTPIQRQFFEEGMAEPHHFNQSFLLETEERLDLNSLDRALSAVTGHHDMLRAVYTDGVQKIRPLAAGAAHELIVYDYTGLSREEDGVMAMEVEADRIQRSLDLSAGPLLKAAVFRVSDRDYLLLVVHHLVIDGISWRILLEDLQRAYQAIQTDGKVLLPPKTGSYQGWSEALERYRESEELKQELSYWQSVEEEIQQGGTHWIGRGNGEGIGHLEVSLDVEQTEALLYQANGAYHTEINDLLITALGQAMQAVTGQNTVSLQMEGHGREGIGEPYAIDRTVGWFTSVYPVAISGLGEGMREDIRHTKETLRKIPNRGMGYGVLYWLRERELTGVQPEVTLNYLGEFGQETDEGPWQLSEQARGEEVSEVNRFGTAISLNGAVMDKRLQMRISYERSECNEEQMHALARELRCKLENVIEHCVSKKEAEHTASDFGERNWSDREFTDVVHRVYEQGYVVKRIYPLTPLQEGMLYHKLSAPDSSSYVVQIVYQMEGRLNENALRESLQLLSAKHEVLRTSIIHTHVSVPRQVLFEQRPVEYTHLDLSGAEHALGVLEQLMKEDVKRGFSLEHDSLLRVASVQLQEDDTRLLLTFHHIIMDGWCMSILLNDLIQFYTEIIEGKSTEEVRRAIVLPTPYEEYVRLIDGKNKTSSLNYWRDLLEDYDGYSGIDAEGQPDGEDGGEESARVELRLSSSETAGIENLCSTYGVTVNTIVEAAWGIVLQKYNNAVDAVFGKIVSGRNVDLPNIEEMIGLFINMIPVRIQSADQAAIGDLLVTLQQQALQSAEHDYCSLADIQSQHEQGSQLIQTMVAFENYFEQAGSDDHGNTLSMLEAREQTNYPLTLLAFKGKLLEFALMYDVSRYGMQEAARILASLRTVLVQMIRNPDITVQEIVLIEDAEMSLILNEFNATDTAYPSDRSVVNLFVDQVTHTPEKIAVVSGEEQVTYRELHERSGRLASQLQALGVKRGEYVGIMADRQVSTIVGILGILKIGGAYMPIDPKYPEQRVKYMLGDSGAKVVLIGEEKVPVLNEAEVVQVSLGAFDGGKKGAAEKEASMSAEMLGTGPAEAGDVAYLIYTSGTTGEPKGVMIEHRSVNRLVKQTNYADFTDARILQTGSLSFDASTFEIWGALLNGGTLFLVEEETLTDPIQFKQVLIDYGINLMFITTALFNQMIRLEPGIFDSVEQLLFGGEATSEEHVEQLLARKSGVRLTNVYGPTENTTFTTYYPLDRSNRLSKTPIGKPISNTQVYIMNESGLCGIGMPGELCVGGAGVGRGYLNQPERTSESFVANPYRPGEWMYRTGDLARWKADGNIEYLGRMDQQVKLRGFRIELGEIESRLLELKNVVEATVQLRKEADDYLCAYVVGSVELDAEEIRESLRQSLPDYMVPSYVVQLESLPLTRNGKLDKKALPETQMQSKKHLEAPRDAIEQCIADAFEEILGVHPIGVHDHFFELGGHSLRTTRLVNSLERRLGTRLSVRDIFAYPTVEMLAKQVKDVAAVSTYTPIPVQPVQECYSMSSAQKRLYIINRMQGGSITYNMPEFMKIQGKLDITRLESALQKLTDRHEPLRTSFMIHNGEPVQLIADHVCIELEYEADQEESVHDSMKAFIRPFDLAKAPLMRAKVKQLHENEAIFMLDFHHIIYDGGSVGILLHDLACLYNGQSLPELGVQYKDYSCWQNKRNLDEQEEYWASEFAGDIPVLELLTDEPRPKEQSYAGSSINYSLDQSLKQAVWDLARTTGATDYMILLSGFMLLLSRYSGQEEIVVGSPIAGRVHPDTEQMLGMFVNILAIRGNLDAELTFYDLVMQLKEKCLRAYDNQEYPFEQLVEKFAGQRDLSRNPIFDVMFALQNHENSKLNLDGAMLEPLEYQHEISKFDLTVSMFETEQGYDLHWEYCTALFRRDTMERMAAQFEKLLKNALNNPGQRLSTIGMVKDAEMSLILNEFNATETAYPSDRSVVNLFVDQVTHTPEKIAVVSGEEQVTYRELHERSGRLASQLQALGVKRGEYVGIMAERQVSTIVGILGILKVGGAYMPIDPKYPEQRVKYMLGDSGAKVVLIGEEKVPMLNEAEVVQVSLGAFAGGKKGAAEKEASMSVEMLGTGPAEAGDVAYLIYTSGTTGEPKGVMIEHRSVNRLVKQTNYADFTDARILQTGSLSFDASTFEIWGALLNGGTLFLVEEETLTDPIQFKQVLIDYGINLMFITTALFNQLIRLEPGIFDSVEQLLFGGEATSEEHVEQLLARKSGVRLTNVYGPTENTTFTTYYPLDRSNRLSKTPIGKPISNTQVYIMNESGLCGIGVPGELCVGGAGVGRGYLNQPERTSESFVANPYRPGEWMYRTGDLARWKADGNIEYLGRMDQQVKLRGFRIELGEIESRLLELKNVVEATVQLRKEADDYLCAYVVGSVELDAEEIRENLRQSLPDYMVPSYVVQLESLPLTRNGKLDKKALPEPDRTSSQAYTAPRDNLEEALVDVFSDVLGMDRIGIDDDFYALGGDSIKAIRILSKLRERGYDIGVRTIMQGRTIRSMREDVKASNGVQAEQGEITGIVKLTPIQRQFFEEGMAEPHHFNQSFLLETEERLDLNSLDQALSAVTGHHDMLRAVYTDGVQKIRPLAAGLAHELTVYDYTGLSREEDGVMAMEVEADRIQRSLDLSGGPLLKAAVFRVSDRDYLLLVVHHLVIDGISWRILLEDLQRAYQAIQTDGKVLLPPKTGSYQGWSEALERYRESEELKQELSYWQSVEEGIQQGGAHWIGRGNGEGIGHLEVSLDVEQTEALLYQANGAYHTEINDLLITALGQAMQAVTGQKTVSLQMEGHGREGIGEPYAIDRTVGWFTSVYPVAISGLGEGMREDIRHTKETLRKIPNRGMGYGVLYWLGERKLTGVQPEVTLNYLGEFGQESDEGPWQLSEQARGEEVSEVNRFGTAISVNGAVMDKRLQMRISYERSECNEEQMHALARELRRKLEDVIEHCTGGSMVSNNRMRTNSGDQNGWRPDPVALLDLVHFQQNVHQSVISRYVPSAMQRLFLSTTGTVIKETIKLKDSWSKERVMEACQRIVRQQSVFRSSYLAENESGSGMIFEHEWNSAWYIPYLDLRYTSPEETRLVYEQIDSMKHISINECQQDLLIKMIVTCDSDRQHSVHVVAHHCVWDKTSTSILEEMFEHQKALIDFSTREAPGEVPGYSHYVAEKHRNNMLINRQELFSVIHMEQFMFEIHRYQEHNASNLLHQSVASMIKLGPHLLNMYKEKPWNLLMYAIGIIARENGLVPKGSSGIPVFILQEDRSYMSGDYKHVLGEFLDMLPVLIDGEVGTLQEHMQKYVERIQKVKRDQNIHYIEMISEVEERMHSWLPSVLSVNFQGAFELTYEELQNLMRTNHYRTTNEVFANRYSNSLVIYYPIYSRLVNDLEQVLQREFDLLETKLSQMKTPFL